MTIMITFLNGNPENNFKKSEILSRECTKYYMYLPFLREWQANCAYFTP